MTNCPNCGAPITGRRCEYCETVFPEYRDTKIETLRSENKAITYSMFVNNLYANAIKSMTAGIVTPNEARRLVGLKEV